MVGHIPPLYSEGLYTFSAPFATVVPANTVLKCMAIRSFEDVYNEGIDVFEAYYLPHSITEADFNIDKANKVSIITLTQVNGIFYHIPSSYILLMPAGNTVPYSHVVLSVSIGSIPDALDLNALKAAVGQVVSDIIGVAGVVAENRAPALSGSVVTQAQHALMEAARLSAVETSTTDRAENIRLNALVASLEDKIASLEAYLIANPPTP